jgi:hypothetical protein
MSDMLEYARVIPYSFILLYNVGRDNERDLARRDMLIFRPGAKASRRRLMLTMDFGRPCFPVFNFSTNGMADAPITVLQHVQETAGDSNYLRTYLSSNIATDSPRQTKSRAKQSSPYSITSIGRPELSRSLQSGSKSVSIE